MGAILVHWSIAPPCIVVWTNTFVLPVRIIVLLFFGLLSLFMSGNVY